MARAPKACSRMRTNGTSVHALAQAARFGPNTTTSSCTCPGTAAAVATIRVGLLARRVEQRQRPRCARHASLLVVGVGQLADHLCHLGHHLDLDLAPPALLPVVVESGDRKRLANVDVISVVAVRLRFFVE